MYYYFNADKQTNKLNTTRQSEMANTSPRHMPVLGNIHPIKIDILMGWIFFRDVISLLARVFIFSIDRATQEVPMKKYLKEIVGPVFFLDIRH